MKETVYRCNRCHKLISGTVHRIGATDEKGKQTKYGALFDNMDLCDSCMEEVILDTIAKIECDPWQQEQNNEPERQQDQAEETTERQNVEPVTYQCSKVMKTCYYARKIGGAMVCNYIEIEGHRRVCDPEECDKYKRVYIKRGRKSKKKPENMPEIVEG